MLLAVAILAVQVGLAQHMAGHGSGHGAKVCSLCVAGDQPAGPSSPLPQVLLLTGPDTPPDFISAESDHPDFRPLPPSRAPPARS